jgi:hypothetical protein
VRCVGGSTSTRLARKPDADFVSCGVRLGTWVADQEDDWRHHRLRKFRQLQLEQLLGWFDEDCV